MEKVLVKTGQTTPAIVGRQDEHLVQDITFDVASFQTEFGPGRVHLAVRRNGDKRAYPVPLEIQGTLATWHMTSMDLAVPGYGEVQLTYFVGDQVAKSELYQFYVRQSLRASERGAPKPEQPYLESVFRNAEQAADAAADAEKSRAAAAGILTQVQLQEGQLQQDISDCRTVVEDAQQVTGELTPKLEQVGALSQQIHEDALSVEGNTQQISAALPQVREAGQSAQDGARRAEEAAGEIAADQQLIAQDKAAVAEDRKAVAADRKTTVEAQGGAEAARDGANTAKSEAEEARDVAKLEADRAARATWSLTSCGVDSTLVMNVSGAIAVKGVGDAIHLANEI